MRYRIGIAGLLMTVAAFAPLAGRAALPKDWILASVTVGDGISAQPIGGGGAGGGGGISFGPGGGTSLAMAGTGHSIGGGPVLLGAGNSFGSAMSVDVFDFANGGTRLHTTSDLGAVDIEITPARDIGFGFFRFAGVIGSFGPGAKRMTILMFATNAVIDSYSVKASGGSAPIVKTGSGSRAIEVAGPDASGVAVDASAVAAGASTVEATLGKGIVGGVTYGCTRCTVEWTGPNNLTGSVTQTNRPELPLPTGDPLPPVNEFDGDPMFAGPAGAWSWSWTGANVRLGPSPSTIGAYAPIGDDWGLFSNIASTPQQPPAQPTPQPRSKPKVEAQKETRTLAATGVASSGRGWVLLGLAALSACWLAGVRSHRAFGARI